MTSLRAWLRQHRDVLVCALVVTLISCTALWRLGLLWPSSEQEVLVVDTARTAYVARNLVEGNGYTTNDLPASLVSFYDREGRLHEARWINADRFPFAAYATAALYTVTGRRDAWTGVVVYNLVTFVLFLTALYVLVRRVTGSQTGGALAVALALLHSHTYVFLYMKDADMLLLSVLTLSGFQRYFARGLEARTWPQMAWFGTVLAWSFLSRPNVGAPFLLALGGLSIAGLVGGVRRIGAGPALRAWARADLVAGVVATLWLVPFLIHTMAEWGSPFFSANGLYQPMLGTRFGMGTDTWWRYVPPSYDYSVGHLWREARGDVIAKFTSSWLATFRTFVGSYFIELALALGALHLPRRDGDGAARLAPGVRGAVLVTLAVFAFNFALLPLYAYRDYSWRHYLGFVMPVFWMAAAATLLHAGRWLAPAWSEARTWVGAHRRAVVLALIAAALLLLFRTPGNEGNLLAMALSRFLQRHWLVGTVALAAVLGLGWIGRWPRSAWLVVAGALLLVLLYRPHRGHKSFTHIHVPMTTEVFAELRKRDGLVASFALQTQVSWNTDRKNITAPEWVMNLYEIARTHRLEIEDIYIESPAAQLTPYDGLFGRAAPGFEGYGRIVAYRDHLPGYRVAFHVEGRRGRPRYRIAPRAKSSTVYTLADRAALAAVYRTPGVLELGDPANVVHTAHGFGGYYRIDGKAAVAATDATRARYTPQVDRPWEDTSITFFVDERVPARVTLELYTLGAAHLDVYWNLDLDAYTPARRRAAQRLGAIDVTAGGWHRVTLDVPPALVRRGLNKLGFRAGAFTAAAACSTDVPEAVCAATPSATLRATALLRAETDEPSAVVNVSAFLGAVTFDGGAPGAVGAR